MKTEISWLDMTAAVEDGVWTSSEPSLEMLLNAIIRLAPGYHPDRDYGLALEAVAQLRGARITAYAGPPPPPHPGDVVY